MMKTRYLAKNFEVSAIGYGAMGLSEFYGAADDAQSLRVLHKLIELDQTFIDTADQYGRGHNETLIGQFLAGLDSATRGKMKVGGRSRPNAASSARPTKLTAAPSTTSRTILPAAATTPLSGSASNASIFSTSIASARQRRLKRAWRA